MEKTRATKRWEIGVCGRGTVHIHYGTGSLHILEEDFLKLLADLQKTAEAVHDLLPEGRSLDNKRLQ